MGVALAGELSFARAAAALVAARASLDQDPAGGPVELDLSGVTRVDSAGLALLLELARHARDRGRELRCTRAPEQLRRLAEFFGISGLLALSA
jgi:phospholipid transport system transporter-binding protein